MSCAERPRKGTPDVTRAVEQEAPQYCQLPSPSHFLTDTPLMFEARTVIKDMCTLKCCQTTMTTSSALCHACQTGIPYQETQKRCWMRLLVGISYDLSPLTPLHVQCFNIHNDVPWYLCCEPFVYSEGGALSGCDSRYTELCLSRGRGRRQVLGYTKIKHDKESHMADNRTMGNESHLWS